MQSDSVTRPGLQTSDLESWREAWLTQQLTGLCSRICRIDGHLRGGLREGE